MGAVPADVSALLDAAITQTKGLVDLNPHETNNTDLLQLTGIDQLSVQVINSNIGMCTCTGCITFIHMMKKVNINIYMRECVFVYFVASVACFQTNYIIIIRFSSGKSILTHRQMFFMLVSEVICFAVCRYPVMDSRTTVCESGGRLNKKDGLTRYGDSHVKDKTS